MGKHLDRAGPTAPATIFPFVARVWSADVRGMAAGWCVARAHAALAISPAHVLLLGHGAFTDSFANGAVWHPTSPARQESGWRRAPGPSPRWRWARSARAPQADGSRRGCAGQAASVRPLWTAAPWTGWSRPSRPGGRPRTCMGEVVGAEAGEVGAGRRAVRACGGRRAGPHAERRVRLIAQVQESERLVSAGVEGPDNHLARPGRLRTRPGRRRTRSSSGSATT